MATGTSVFISYASDTKPLAEELTKALESQGIEPWVDFKMRPGQRSREELQRAIDAAQWFVILVGSKSRATPWQEAEWSAALARSWADREKKVLPVVFGEGDAPPFLRNWVSLRINPEREASTWTHHVLGALWNLEAVQGSSPQSRAERHERLDHIRKAAQELRKGQPEEPPAVRPKVQSE